MKNAPHKEPRIEERTIRLSKTVKYQGINLDHMLNWHKHIESGIYKAYRCCSFSRRAKGSK